MVDLCRLCLNQEVKLYNIFTHNGRRCTNIVQYVFHFFSIEIKESDKVSTKVCQDCLDFIILCCQKQIQYQKNERIICSLYSSANKNKIKNCHPSIYKLMREQKCIKLPKTVLDKNIDVRVDLSIRNECLNIKVNGNLIKLNDGSQEVIMCMDKVHLEQQKPGTEAISGRPTNQSYCSRESSRLHGGSEEVTMCIDKIKLEQQKPGTEAISGRPTNQSYCSLESSRLHDGFKEVIMCVDKIKLGQQGPETEVISECPANQPYCSLESSRLHGGSEEVIICMHKIKLEQEEPTTEVISECPKVDAAPMNQLNCSRRKSKRPCMYGDPILYEEYENNLLKFVFDQNECGSIQNSQIATSRSPRKHSATLSRVRKANKTVRRELQEVACTTEIVMCTEDTWNKFYEKNYEQSVFLCYCNSLFDDLNSLQSHWLSCADKFNLPADQSRPLTFH